MAKESTKVPRFLSSLVGKLVDLSERKLSGLAHHVIATDEAIAKRFSNVSVKTTTIYNYPRLSLFSPDPIRVLELMRRYKDKNLLIYAGGMRENKGIFQMLKAMKILKNFREDVMLILLGEMSKGIQEPVISEIKKMKIQDYVEIVGRIPHNDVVHYVSISKIGLIANLPTEKWNQNIPVKMFEYMACGVPVLGADLPPIASYINRARCGKLFDSTSVEAMANGVLTILEDRKEWKRMSDAGKWAVQHLWNWDMMEDRLFSVYGELIGK